MAFKLCIFCLFCSGIFLSNFYTQTLSLPEFLNAVVQNHPTVKQSQNNVMKASAFIRKTRGDLDPKLSFNKDNKQFDKKNYFDQTLFKLNIPTTTGISVSPFFQQNNGIYLNPADKTPKKGLYGVGVKVPIAKGLCTNKRQTAIKKAKLFQRQTTFQQQLTINEILYKAVVEYANWLYKQRRLIVYQKGVENAQLRLENVRSNFQLGDKSAIDTLETFVFLNAQLLTYQKAQMELAQQMQNVSLFLWSNENTPLTLQPDMQVDTQTIDNVAKNLMVSDNENWEQNIQNHPKINLLDTKKQSLELSKTLYRNQLLPKIDVKYNILSDNISNYTFDPNQYKWGISMGVPLFLRKARGNLKMIRYDLQNIDLQKKQIINTLQNQITILKNNLNAYKNQLDVAKKTAYGYEQLTAFEMRKMNAGESNVFTVNYRATKSIESHLKWIEIENKILKSYAKLFKIKADISIQKL